MASNEDSLPLIEALRLAPSSNSLSEFDFDGFPTPAPPLTTAPTTDAITPSSTLMNNSNHSEKPIQVITQPLKNTFSSSPIYSSSSPNARPSSMSTPSSLITTLHPYCPPPHRTPHHPIFLSPSSFYYLSFCKPSSRSDRSRLVTVTSEAQARALSALTELAGKPIPAEPHPTLNTCTGTVSIPPNACPMFNKNWSDCWQYSVTLFLLEANINLMSILPRLASIDKTSPMRFILVDCLIMSDNINPFLVNVKHVGVLATQPNIVAPQPDALYVPNLVMTVQIARVSQVHVPIVETPIMCFIGAALPIILRSAPLPSTQDISASPKVSFPNTQNLRPMSTHPIHQSNPFSILNPDTPISTTSRIPTPPHFNPTVPIKPPDTTPSPIPVPLSQPPDT
ncbi:mucin-2-like [Penaeus vannamei]|uniref:mucin-2-like n=1 Tax=Penaeus vannamei TaxID=6689 RepID=UPI00387F54EC